VDPWAAMFNPATPPQTTHLIVAAFMVAGFGMASVYAVAWLRGRRDRYHRFGFTIPFTLAAVLTPVQIVVGDWAARFLHERQPIKLAAIEGVFRTGSHVPLHVGGVYLDGEMRYAIEIPSGLSLLSGYKPSTVITGLETVPPQDRPPVNIVHLAFQSMVGVGFALLALSGLFALVWWRRQRLPETPWFWRAAALSGVGAAFALEAGWVTTEVGRQPWVVYGVLRTADAVNPAPGLTWGFYLVTFVYAVLTAITIVVLRRMTRSTPVPDEITDADVEAVHA
ncbi:MAG TPA: cytochrome ubiquinol oxidase subunit I, partial [Kribbellaceae bacterium]|nr:cytochrome ubiquinol oxidase subunit I [Kribbellaceae bacterium]